MSDLDEFKTEILEMLDCAEKALLEFDKLPDGTSNHLFFDEIFRAYHNIKGAAGMLDWPQLQHHVHQLENILMQTKSSLSIPKKYINWFLTGNDVTRQIIAGESFSFDYSPEEKLDLKIENDQNTDETKNTQQEAISDEFYAEMSEALERTTHSLLKIEAGQGDGEVLNSIYRDIHTIKGAVQLYGMSAASSLSHGMESCLESFRQRGNIEMDPALTGTLLLCVDLLGQCIQHQISQEVIKEVGFMIELLKPFTQESVTAQIKNTTPQGKITENVSSQESKTLNIPELKSSQDLSEKSDSTIRVQVSLLDRVMTLMGEMVLVRNQIVQYSSRSDDLEFLNLSQKLDVVTSELQEETIKTRMQPIGNILSKFQRVVRDLSGQLNKKINLNLVGTETELDKTLLEAIKDPLTHILRNACDHGIELPQERLQNGKSEMGSITIHAYHEGGQVVVDISDDGRGLSREKIIKKAYEKGLLTLERSEGMNDHEVFSLIFAPGFSTAEKVTNVSGRGVGMDVVRSNIEKIAGVVELKSQEGFGTKITIKVPLTLAIVSALIVKTCNERYAIPQMTLLELIRIQGKSIENVHGSPVYRLRGDVLPLIDLKSVFSIKLNKDFCQEDDLNVVVLKSQYGNFGLIVDEIIDTLDIVVKPLASFLRSLTIYSGATVLGDGDVAFILDIQGIAHRHLLAMNDREDIGSGSSRIIEDEFIFDEQREFVVFGARSPAKHGIPLKFVRRMEEFKKTEIEFSGTQKVVRYRGGVLKLISINDVLGFSDKSDEVEVIQVVVVSVDDQLFGFEVDKILDVLSSTDPFDEEIDNPSCILGNLVTKEEIIVVLNPEEIVRKQIRSSRSSFGENSSSESGYRILLVDDTEPIRNRVAVFLRGKGHTVFTGEDGIDGLRKIAEKKFGIDLIISDLHMPKMNGFDFASKVRSLEAMKEVPMIAFTTKNEELDLKQAKMVGFNSYLEKGKLKLLPLLIDECVGNKRKSA